MKRLAVCLVLAAGILGCGDLSAQGVRLDVRATVGPADTKMPEIVRNATKIEAIAPKLRLEATISTAAKVPFPATIEWYVFGKITDEAKQAGRTSGAEWTVMQSSKEAVSVKPPLGAKSTIFAYGPGQVRNGARSEGWLVRLVSTDGRVLDAKASAPNLLALARDQTRLSALVAAKPTGDASGGDPELPLEVIARIKAEAEKNWPGNPEMQAIEIKNKTDYHKSAYKK
jgi:hypothetical protein